MAIPNTTHRILVERLGGTDPTDFIGNEGEVFYDPDAGSPTLRLSDGSTAGGIAIGGGGSASLNTVLGVGNTSDLGMSVGLSTVSELHTYEIQAPVDATILRIQASNNGDAYFTIPTNDNSSTQNVIIGNELRGIQLVGGVVLESDVLSPQLTGGTNISPTNIPLTLGYAVLNEGAGGNGWFNLPDGQEGQVIHLIMGLTDSLNAAQISITIQNCGWIIDVGGEGSPIYQPTSGAAVYTPFTQVPNSMVTLLFAQGNWNVTTGTVIND